MLLPAMAKKLQSVIYYSSRRNANRGYKRGCAIAQPTEPVRAHSTPRSIANDHYLVAPCMLADGQQMSIRRLLLFMGETLGLFGVGTPT